MKRTELKINEANGKKYLISAFELETDEEVAMWEEKIERGDTKSRAGFTKTEWADVSKSRIAIDFDGVIHSYSSGWVPNEIPDPPVPGALQAVLRYLEHGIDVVVHTCRALEPEGLLATQAWLKKHGFPELEVTAVKPHANVYLDDRALHFHGDNYPAPSVVKKFRPWNK